jgi:hypothetical protein
VVRLIVSSLPNEAFDADARDRKKPQISVMMRLFVTERVGLLSRSRMTSVYFLSHKLMMS